MGARISTLLKSLLNHCMCVLCFHAIQWICYSMINLCQGYIKYKKSFPSFPHSLQFFLPVKLHFIFATETTYAFKLQVWIKVWKETKLSKIHRKKFVKIVLENFWRPLNTWASSNFLLFLKYSVHIGVFSFAMITSVHIVFNLV